MPMAALKMGPEVEEDGEQRPRKSLRMESVVALVLQQNSELQKEVFALRQGQVTTEKKKEDTVGVGLTMARACGAGLALGQRRFQLASALNSLEGPVQPSRKEQPQVFFPPGDGGSGAERPQRKVKALQDRAAAYGEQLNGEVDGPGHDGRWWSGTCRSEDSRPSSAR